MITLRHQNGPEQPGRFGLSAMNCPLVPLSSVATVQLGKMLSPKAQTSGRPYPYIRNSNVQWGLLDLSDLLEMDFSEEEQAKFSIRRGDLLVCEGGEPGRCAYVERDLPGIYFQKALMRIRPTGDQIDTRFLGHYFRSLAANGVFASGGNQATIAHFPAVRMNALLVPAPPLAAQRRIANILDRADAIRRKRKQAIALTDALLRSTFLEMFGDPITNPKGWPTATVEELSGELKYGTSARCDSEPASDSIAVLRIPNVAGGRIDWEDLKYATLPAAETERLKLRRGDILFVRSGCGSFGTTVT